MLFNINTLEWDDEILKELNIPKCMLPEPKPSAYTVKQILHFWADQSLLPVRREIRADFGQTCFMPGEARIPPVRDASFLGTGETPVFPRTDLSTIVGAGRKS